MRKSQMRKVGMEVFGDEDRCMKPRCIVCVWQISANKDESESMVHLIQTNYIHNCEHRSNSLITHGTIKSGGRRVAGIYPSYANANTQSVMYNGRLLSLTNVEINRITCTQDKS